MTRLWRLLPLACAVVASDPGKEFDSYDTDKNGLLDAQELRTAFKDFTEDQLHAFWAAVDKSQRGYFNKTEYIDFALGQAENSEV
jgi:Ca2+-binding EF-hand superfamily protein